jgi:hypothetical protein
MTRLDTFSRMLVLSVGLHTLVAAQTSVECVNPPLLAAKEINRSSCRLLVGTTVERYLENKPTSAYATEFDRRELAVAYGKNSARVKAVAGIDGDVKNSLVESQFLEPPFVNLISKVFPMKRFRRRGNWVIYAVQIEYGAQGGAPGFPLCCSTALRSSNKKTIVIAECFPLEERERFYQTLDSIHR